MLLDPETYIPAEVARRTELARQTYRAAPRPLVRPNRRSRLIAVLRLGRNPATSV